MLFLFRIVSTIIACEGNYGHVKCRPGYVIKVLSANYGRTSRKICRSKSVRTTKCINKGTLGKVKQLCQNRRRCRLLATSRVFGNACKGTKKYLSVFYTCRPKRKFFFLFHFQNKGQNVFFL